MAMDRSGRRPRYSEASLVKKLEELGIGRPSTYASIIEVLQRRNYVKIDRTGLSWPGGANLWIVCGSTVMLSWPNSLRIGPSRTRAPTFLCAVQYRVCCAAIKGVFWQPLNVRARNVRGPSVDCYS